MVAFAKDGTNGSLEAIQREIEQEYREALATFQTRPPVLAEISADIQTRGGVVLMGMGASFAACRIGGLALREAGIDTGITPISEVLYGPQIGRGAVKIVVSQSGGSAEAVRYARIAGNACYALTVENGSPLAKLLPALVATGGREFGFTATRSFAVSIAQIVAIAATLGFGTEDFEAALETADGLAVDVSQGLEALAGVETLIFTGRGWQCGLAEMGALAFMELARCPAMALEGGQLRHGPTEALGPKVGVVALRDGGPASPLVDGLAVLCRDAGAPIVILDSSGLPPSNGACTIGLPFSSGIGATMILLRPLQNLILGLATRRVVDIGTPLRCSKVTDSE